MADYYKNIDRLGCETPYHRTARGVQYTVVDDLATEPVDLQFFKEHARIDFDTDDLLSASYLKAARQELEAWGQISFGVKTMRLMALELPNNWHLKYGPVNNVTSTGYTNFGDILKEGGTELTVEYTTTGIINDTIRIAICLVAAARYSIRENIIVNINGTVQQPNEMIDEARKSIQQFINITLF